MPKGGTATEDIVTMCGSKSKGADVVTSEEKKMGENMNLEPDKFTATEDLAAMHDSQKRWDEPEVVREKILEAN